MFSTVPSITDGLLGRHCLHTRGIITGALSDLLVQITTAAELFVLPRVSGTIQSLLVSMRAGNEHAAEMLVMLLQQEFSKIMFTLKCGKMVEASNY